MTRSQIALILGFIACVSLLIALFSAAAPTFFYSAAVIFAVLAFLYHRGSRTA